MTLKTSDVAVCCSRARFRSRVLAWTCRPRRAFSMAMRGLDSAQALLQALSSSATGASRWR